MRTVAISVAMAAILVVAGGSGQRRPQQRVAVGSRSTPSITGVPQERSTV